MKYPPPTSSLIFKKNPDSQEFKNKILSHPSNLKKKLETDLLNFLWRY